MCDISTQRVLKALKMSYIYKLYLDTIMPTLHGEKDDIS